MTTKNDFVPKSNSHCIVCKDSATTDPETASYIAFAGNTQPLTEIGQCTGCKNYFCDKHYVVYVYDDDVGTISDSHFCSNCYGSHRQKEEKRADWYRENVPIVGRLIAWCMRMESAKIYGPGKM